MASRLAVSLLLIAPLVGVRMLAAQHTGAPPGGQHQGGQHQGGQHQGGQHQRGDTAFAGMQQRGQQVMGADQYTSSHRFDDLPDGGRIELQRDGADPAGAAAIRRHFADIAGKFADGDFDAPGLVHAQDVPGTRVMAAKRSLITYTVEVLPRGAALRIASPDTEAVAAIHQFLQFQRREHRTGQRP